MIQIAMDKENVNIGLLTSFFVMELQDHLKMNTISLVKIRELF
jgi:hypothetical protein